MSKSNWNGSSGWGAISDPTGVLTGRVLVASAGTSSTTEDYLTQIVGTSSDFDAANYSTKIQFAWPASTSAHPFAEGTLGIVNRSYTYSGDPSLAQNAYIGELDYSLNKVNIIRRVDGTDTIINSGTLPSDAISRGVSHTLEFRTYGTTSVTLQLLLNNSVIANVGDTAANKLVSGNPGLKISSGTVYINDFTIMEYTSDGKAPADWTPDSVTGVTLAGWWKADKGTTVAGSSLSSWADQSVNSNDLAQASAASQPLFNLTRINNLPAIKFDGTASLSAVNDATMNMNSDGVSFFALMKTESFTYNDTNTLAGKGASYSASINSTKSFKFVGTSTIEPASFVGTTSVYSLFSYVTDKDNDTGVGGIYVDGTLVASMTDGADADNTSELLVGSNVQADIAEMILVKGQCSVADRQKIEGYIAHRFNTWPRLPSDHPYKYIKPTITG